MMGMAMETAATVAMAVAAAAATATTATAAVERFQTHAGKQESVHIYAHVREISPSITYVCLAYLHSLQKLTSI